MAFFKLASATCRSPYAGIEDLENMDMADPGMAEIRNAVGLLQGGERQAAREELLRLWGVWGERDAPLQRTTLAHFLADTEAIAADELEWDLVALESATGSRGAHDLDAIDPSLDSFLPSLHLNVGDALRRTGQFGLARMHVENGLARADTLGEDGYAKMVKAGLVRLGSRIESDQ